VSDASLSRPRDDDAAAELAPCTGGPSGGPRPVRAHRSRLEDRFPVLERVARPHGVVTVAYRILADITSLDDPRGPRTASVRSCLDEGQHRAVGVARLTYEGGSSESAPRIVSAAHPACNFITRTEAAPATS
jgi:hypothetical protein